jgi:hypothetical protein
MLPQTFQGISFNQDVVDVATGKLAVWCEPIIHEVLEGTGPGFNPEGHLPELVLYPPAGKRRVVTHTSWYPDAEKCGLQVKTGEVL